MARRRRRARKGPGRPSGRVREGWLAVPRDWIERVKRGELTMEQFAVLVCIAAEANRDSEPSATEVYNTGERILLAKGQALVGARKFAERHGMGARGRHVVTRALRRGEGLGICELPAAKSEPPPEPPREPPREPPGAPPPTLVEYVRDKEIMFPRENSEPPPEPPRKPPREPPREPIQQRTRDKNKEQSSERGAETSSAHPRTAADGAEDVKKKKPPPQPALVNAIVAELAQVYERVRGEKYLHNRHLDRAAVRRLLEAGSSRSTIVARWPKVLSAEKPFHCDTIAELGMSRVWNHFSGSNGASSRQQFRAEPTPASAPDAMEEGYHEF